MIPSHDNLVERAWQLEMGQIKPYSPISSVGSFGKRSDRRFSEQEGQQVLRLPYQVR